jgi:hypothetical protein
MAGRRQSVHQGILRKASDDRLYDPFETGRNVARQRNSSTLNQPAVVPLLEFPVRIKPPQNSMSGVGRQHCFALLPCILHLGDPGAGGNGNSSASGPTVNSERRLFRYKQETWSKLSYSDSYLQSMKSQALLGGKSGEGCRVRFGAAARAEKLTHSCPRFDPAPGLRLSTLRCRANSIGKIKRAATLVML